MLSLCVSFFFNLFLFMFGNVVVVKKKPSVALKTVRERGREGKKLLFYIIKRDLLFFVFFSFQSLQKQQQLS